MDRALASAIAHRRHPIAAPVSDENAYLLIQELDLPPGGRVLDLGCGFGEWLRTALRVFPDAAGVGVDTSEPALDEARSRAAVERSIRERIRFEPADAATWRGGGVSSTPSSASGPRTRSAASVRP